MRNFILAVIISSSYTFLPTLAFGHDDAENKEFVIANFIDSVAKMYCSDHKMAEYIKSSIAEMSDIRVDFEGRDGNIRIFNPVSQAQIIVPTSSNCIFKLDIK